VDIVDVEGVLHRGVAELVGLPISRPALEAAAGEEDRVAVDVVVAPAGFADLRRMGRASHFPRPEDDGLVEKAALLKIDEKGRNGALGDARVLFMVRLQLAVLVPGRVVAVEARTGDLDETHPGFDEAARTQGLGRVEPFVRVR